ncbi:hypothetical protein EYZ11_010618 [Aspergillus tanneri]|uniref:Uncharacterized protein n=1 Tax=Aspergillus tanneri TaxID=1220188 RepID=A0A4S3JA95_9EURO|nr:uncharacterized protein ATNIH1004_001878 [Aspergillus tanneri]KAA8641413.1 hypothetical protein ATNIH1004_001878 [Aspergillus tanneri]THC89921.1 hypothetical protein EYZ11_010618 [Aspergillus tanneri]
MYSEPDREVSPDRPETPSSFECYITLRGGRSSAADLSPSSLNHAKHERLTDSEEYKRAVFNASFLQAENSWLRRTRKSAIALYEGTVEPTIEVLSNGSDNIHDALTQFHVAFGAVNQALAICDGEVASDVEATLRDLIPAFETCREGLAKVRSASENLKSGAQTFSDRITESNRSYENFFGITYEEGDEVTPTIKR